MKTTHNWLSTAVNYQFAQAGKVDLIQQHLANMIANPSDEQVIAVGTALANLGSDLQLASADITVHSTILATN
ncbi:DUF1659 domain-containing protein [Bombilactobacillus bombi]|uniref:DUF1659 domain-containing protein n=1 Tax=Bombilactobacillus bombi TaxID=1303590 RepID=UPI0015E615E1|nr:hypothetical protein [Bombilactobacillus bombi]MBA1434296.1 hypothetical protein [Bombilactobacillus bombi]